MTVGLKVIDRQRAIMVYMRVQCQHQCRTLLNDPYPCVATAMEPTLVAFGTLKPTFQIQIVCWKIGCVPPFTHAVAQALEGLSLENRQCRGISTSSPDIPECS